MGKIEYLRKQVWGLECGGNHKLALLFIAERTRLSVAKVKVGDIAKSCNISHRQAQYVIHQLIDDGYLHVINQGSNGTAATYKITNKQGEEFSIVAGCRKLHPLYISVHKEVDRKSKAPNQGLIAVNDPEINHPVLVRGV